ncbi:putative protein OS=Bosea thiooxidans OX=53254 GN=SAMN05660750_04068 PE=4 SV=1 [Bosea thiooxidans]|uniref:Uncharacterized protein n=1 Tax=Bosea thiooxidans TaxID=53254 RepID=A0A1T5GI19_9HYPH|nr:hypothetical protein [Bosea thiooxidans]SKC08026.1 hypothetical protein SAMN05660750_04068 [Bosea thiooxidans]
MQPANDNSPLYLPEQAIAQRILGPKAKVRWDSLALVLEREGLPRVDPLTGCRYWPAVREFLDRRHGIRQSALPSAADGVEVWQ